MNFLSQVENRKILDIIEILKNYLQGKDNSIILTLIAFFAKGHVLIEDFPGIGKTTLALAFSKILGLKFGRIQCTPDLLPSDITGINIFDKNSNDFIFKKGPIFNNVVLIDEVNRATQKTQSAFLEAMEERQVTVDGKTYKIEEPFFVIATQNPAEFSGTFSLPSSQMDRFILSFSIGFPSKNDELEILKKGSLRDQLDNISLVIDKNEIFEIQKSIDKVYVSDKVLNFILEIVQLTRESKYFLYGLSPRASLSLQKCAKTYAYFCNRDYVNFYDIKILSIPVLAHRLVLKDSYLSVEKKEIINEIINKIPAIA